MIHGNVPGLTHHVFFISAGKCEIVKRVGFVRCVSPFLRPELILQGSKSEKADPKKFLNKPYGRRLRRLTPEDHYLTVLTLTAGEYFGVGKYIYILELGNTQNKPVLWKQKVFKMTISLQLINLFCRKQNV